MEQSSRTLQSTDDRLILLRRELELLKEGSLAWYKCQEEINSITAQRFLNYVNT
jgi:hypothetical protein